MKLRFICGAMAVLPSFAFASKVAIIDSGTDYLHRDLANQYEMNSGEVANNKIDEDGNGYVDDLHGWNFAEQNNQVIDYSYLGTFPGDIKTFFEIQVRVLEGTASQADKDWIKAKKEDQEFLKELQKFGNFTHGTHVAGIVAKADQDNKVFAVKIIPTEVKLPFTEFLERNGFFRSEQTLFGASSLKEMLFKQALTLLASQQGKALTVAGQYVGLRDADVANGSFGTSAAAIRPLIEQLYNAFFKEEERDPSKVDEFVSHFLNAVIKEMTAFVKAAPTTLFVFAAGNDGTNNDVMPVSPANVKEVNSISVAATLRNKTLASFSNYGEKMVEVAAPGVGILSTIPGNETMVMSGTSQAAPYVAGVAAAIKNQNPHLKPHEVKAILVGTVDTKAWLKGKVKSSGVVNSARAVAAAKAALTMSVSSAIAQAKTSVRDMPEAGVSSFSRARFGSKEEAMVLPLPSMFGSAE